MTVVLRSNRQSMMCCAMLLIIQGLATNIKALSALDNCILEDVAGFGAINGCIFKKIKVIRLFYLLDCKSANDL